MKWQQCTCTFTLDLRPILYLAFYRYAANPAYTQKVEVMSNRGLVSMH